MLVTWKKNAKGSADDDDIDDADDVDDDDYGGEGKETDDDGEKKERGCDADASGGVVVQSDGYED